MQPGVIGLCFVSGTFSSTVMKPMRVRMLAFSVLLLFFFFFVLAMPTSF
jgi:hypothetical protein